MGPRDRDLPVSGPVVRPADHVQVDRRDSMVDDCHTGAAATVAAPSRTVREERPASGPVKMVRFKFATMEQPAQAPINSDKSFGGKRKTELSDLVEKGKSILSKRKQEQAADINEDEMVAVRAEAEDGAMTFWIGRLRKKMGKQCKVWWYKELKKENQPSSWVYAFNDVKRGKTVVNVPHIDNIAVASIIGHSFSLDHRARIPAPVQEMIEDMMELMKKKQRK